MLCVLSISWSVHHQTHIEVGSAEQLTGETGSLFGIAGGQCGANHPSRPGEMYPAGSQSFGRITKKMIAEGIMLGEAFLHLQDGAFADGEENAVEALSFVTGREDDTPGQTDILHDALQFAKGVKDGVSLPSKRAVQVVQDFIGRGRIHDFLARAIL
jgi:hypothetical protein